MIAFINSIVAGAIVTLLVHSVSSGDQIGVALTVGVTTAVTLIAIFLAYQGWRYSATAQTTSRAA